MSNDAVPSFASSTACPRNCVRLESLAEGSSQWTKQDRGRFSGRGGIDEKSGGAASREIGKRDVVDLYALAVLDSFFFNLEGVKRRQQR